jgi:ubiquitin-like protein Pup
MPERKREQKPAPKERDSEIADVAAPVESEKAEKLKGDIDDLLDEIDSVLEDNAEDFVRNYVQTGGQ